MASSPSSATSTHLARLMARESEAARQLLELLGEEQRLLSHRRVNELAGLTPTKEALLDALDRLGKEQRELFEDHGVACDNTSVRAWLKISGRPELETQWRQLALRLAACRIQNAKNGAVVKTLSRYTQQVLSIFAGQSDEGRVYDPAGQERVLAAPRYTTSV